MRGTLSRYMWSFDLLYILIIAVFRDQSLIEILNVETVEKLFLVQIVHMKHFTFTQHYLVTGYVFYLSSKLVLHFSLDLGGSILPLHW